MIYGGALARASESKLTSNTSIRRIMAVLVVPRRLRPATRRLARRKRAVRALRRKLAAQHRQHRIMPQVIVVIRSSQPSAIPTIRCGAIVLTSCSTSSAARVGEHAANRVVSWIAGSVSPNSIAPASDVIAPPSNEVTIRRPLTGTISNSVVVNALSPSGTPLPRPVHLPNTMRSPS